MNITHLTRWLATGGDLPPDPISAREALDDIVASGVTHILDCRIEWSDEELVNEHSPHVAYLHNGADDAGQRMPDEWFDRGVEFALEALDDPEAKVLAHCHMGINRGPSMAFAILLALGADPIVALDLIRGARPIAAIGYAEDALDWYHRLMDVPETTRAADRRRVAEWRRANQIDVAGIIRRIRQAEAGA